jgi:hypothetical protein
MSFERLEKNIQIKAPLTGRPSPRDWESFNAEHLVLPKDYKTYVSRLGDGVLADFFWIWSPFSPSAELNWCIQQQEWLAAFRELARNSAPLFEGTKFYPEPEGLLPLGHTMNGDTIFWVTKGQPEDWTIAVGRTPPFDLVELNLTDFLFRCLTEPPHTKNLPDLRQAPKLFSQQATWLQKHTD